MSNTDRTRRKVTRRSTVDEAAKNPSTSRRRTQAERSETTRKLILDATIRILVRKGAAGLRTGEVVKEAGASAGSFGDRRADPVFWSRPFGGRCLKSRAFHLR